MQGNKILIASEPKGVFDEGTISGTPSPGTLMQIAAATEPVGGRFTFEVYSADADGDQRAIIVLLEKGEGYSYSDAYVNGDRCFVYYPLPGEDINMIVSASGTSTGDSQAIGDLYIADSGTGLLIATSSGEESEPFICMQTTTDVVAGGTVVWCRVTGK